MTNEITHRLERNVHVPSARSTIGGVALWACVLIAAGHGVAPLGLIPYFALGHDSPMPWRVVGITASLGIGLLVAGQLLAVRWCFALGMALLAAGWLVGMRESEARLVSLVTSLPYLWLSWAHVQRLASRATE
jgi:hypothetical protein